MKQTASLETLITALILFTVAGIQYSADQQQKVTHFARGEDEMKNQSASAHDMATHWELDRDEAALGWVAVAAAGFLASSFFVSGPIWRTLSDLRSGITRQRRSRPAAPKTAQPEVFCYSKGNLMPDGISVSRLSSTAYRAAGPTRPWKPENR